MGFPFLLTQFNRGISKRGGTRYFATILPSGEKVERELSPVEREFINVKEAQFSKFGLYRKKTTNEETLYKLFQLAQPGNKMDYAACVFAMNHFYNFGVEMNHHDFTNRWLATAVETGRIDEAVAIVKLWNTWLSCPPRIEFVEILMGMVNAGQSRELLAAIRENWQMPLSVCSYVTVISKELAQSGNALEGFVLWEDACKMDLSLPASLGKILVERLLEDGFTVEAKSVQASLQKHSIGGLY